MMIRITRPEKSSHIQGGLVAGGAWGRRWSVRVRPHALGTVGRKTAAYPIMQRISPLATVSPLL